MSKVKPYIITEATRFAFSQIALLQNKRVKDKKTKTVEGIDITVFGEKTRFCKPFQKCNVVIPYDTGIDPYSGLLDAAVNLDVVDKSGAWYTFEGEKFQGKGSDEQMEKILQKLVEQDEDGSIVLDFDDEEETDG